MAASHEFRDQGPHRPYEFQWHTDSDYAAKVVAELALRVYEIELMISELDLSDREKEAHGMLDLFIVLLKEEIIPKLEEGDVDNMDLTWYSVQFAMAHTLLFEEYSSLVGDASAFMLTTVVMPVD